MRESRIQRILATVRPATLVLFTVFLLPAGAAGDLAAVWTVGEVSGLAVDDDGNVWFTQRVALKIGRLEPSTGDVTLWPIPYQDGAKNDGGGNPESILVDAAGDVWFSEIPVTVGGGESRLARFDPDTETFEEWLVNPDWFNGYAGTVASGPIGLTEGPDGRIWFNDRASRPSHVGWVDPVSGAKAVVAVPTPASWPFWRGGSADVAVVDGLVWISHGVKASVAGKALYTADLGLSAFQNRGIDRAFDLVADASGNLWISTRDLTLVRRTPDGTFQVYAIPETPYGARSVYLAVDSQGVVWSSSYDFIMLRFDPATEVFEEISTRPLTSHYVHVDSRDRVWTHDSSKIALVGGTGNRPPVATCADVTAAADAACLADASVDGGCFDPEGGPLSLVQAPPAPYPLGETAVTLTAADAQGLEASCGATVTVIDLAAPVIDCGTPVTVAPRELPVSFQATATDNCGAAEAAVSGFKCRMVNPAGKEVPASPCRAEIDGGALTLLSAPANDKTTVTWDAVGVDLSGNSLVRRCSVEVVPPGQNR